MIQLQLFPESLFTNNIAKVTRDDFAWHRKELLYYNDPVNYTMSVLVTVLSLADKNLVAIYGEDELRWFIAYAKKTGGVPVLIHACTDTTHWTVDAHGNRKITPEPSRLTVVTFESLSTERVVFSEQEEKKKKRTKRK